MISSGVLHDLHSPRQNSSNPSSVGSDLPASIQLLLRFQRLLMSRLLIVEDDETDYSSDCHNAEGCCLLLKKYLQLVTNHVMETLSIATSLASTNSSLVPLIRATLSKDVTGLLLGELCTSLLVVCHHASSVIVSCDLLPVLINLLPSLDAFNQVSLGTSIQDDQDMQWPGVFSKVLPSETSQPLPILRKADLENHNREGGLWVIVDDKVYDLESMKLAGGPCCPELLQKFCGEDATEAFTAVKHSPLAHDLMANYVVGVYLDPTKQSIPMPTGLEFSRLSTPFLDTERTLGLIIGTITSLMGQEPCPAVACSAGSTKVHASPSSSSENPTNEFNAVASYGKWIKAPFMRAGCQTVQPPDPYDEEKGEAKTGSSVTTPGSVITTPGDYTFAPRAPGIVGRPQPTAAKEDFPMTASQGTLGSPTKLVRVDVEAYFVQKSESLLAALIDGRIQDPYLSQYQMIADKEVSVSCTSHPLRTNFPPDHPIEEAGRHLTAALLRHTNLATSAIEVIEEVIFFFFFFEGLYFQENSI